MNPMDHLVLVVPLMKNFEQMNIQNELKKMILKKKFSSLYESLDLPPSTAII